MIANAGNYPPAAHVHELLAGLHESQRERYAKITNPLRRDTWLKGRAFLVDALAFRFGHCDPESIRSHPDGGVYLQNNPTYISLSHSHHMFVISLSDTRIGVDIEYMKMRNLIRQDTEVFSETENRYLGRLTESDRLVVFYTYWTLKEAACKATRLPLLACLQGVRFEMQNHSFQLPPSVSGETWYFLSASIAANWRMALAMAGNGRPHRIEYRQWGADRQWHRLKPDLQAYTPSAAPRRAQ